MRKDEILRILRESGGYVSGEEISNQMGVSRTAIWKQICDLRDEGYDISAVSKRGYVLKSEPDIMTKEAVLSQIATETFGRNMEYFDEIDSTNNYCKQQAEMGAEHGFLVVADRQVSGRGRRGRVWETPSGISIAMSLLLRPDIATECASMITLVAALSVAHAIRNVSGLDAKIKWPNDIVINGKKVCGILTEMSVEFSAINYVVVGIGINVNNASFPEELADMATSIYLEKHEMVSRSKLIAEILINFERYYRIFLETQDMSGLKDVYEERLVNKDERVRVMSANGRVDDEGTALGIDDIGRLVIKSDDGRQKNIMAGEVSVRGLYGYV